MTRLLHSSPAVHWLIEEEKGLRMKRVLIAVVLFMIFGQLSNAEIKTAKPYSIYLTIPVPAKNIGPENLCISESGALMAVVGGKTSIYQDGKWQSTNEKPKDTGFEVNKEGMSHIVSKGDEVIFSVNWMQTLFPIDESTAYGTNNNKVYRIDMKTGVKEAICYVDGWNSADWAQSVLVSDDTLYVIQTYIPLIQAIDLAALDSQGYSALNIAVASDMDIGNVVLSTAEELFLDQYIGTMVDMQVMTADQLRLDLMSNPGRFDLIVAEPSLWNDLAQADVFEDLETHEALADAWRLWIDMSPMCRYKGKLMGVTLWDNCDVLSVNSQLVPLLDDIEWPQPDWTWDDFLALARACRKDLNEDGKPDLYVAYQRMFYPDWNIIRNFSLPVHQAALLYQNGVIHDLDIPEVFNMLSVWKTCYEEGLFYPADGSYEEPHSGVVVFAENLPANWAQYEGGNDIRLTMPGLSETLHCNPADSILMSVNAHSHNIEKAVYFTEMFMRYGADEHAYLKINTYFRKEIFPYQSTWKEPTPFYESHYVSALENAYRDTWDMSLYDDMEKQLSRYIQGQITAEECVRLWQEKLRMTEME